MKETEKKGDDSVRYRGRCTDIFVISNKRSSNRHHTNGKEEMPKKEQDKYQISTPLRTV